MQDFPLLFEPHAERTSSKNLHTVMPDCETASEGYAKRFSGAIGEYLLERQRETVRKVLERHLPKPMRVLEVGGGHAQLTSLLLSLGHQVTVHGSDRSCREGLLRNNVSEVEFVVGPLEALPFSAKSFDLVLAFRLLPHIRDTRDFLYQLTTIASRGVLVDFASLVGLNIFTPMLFPLKKRLEGNTREYFLHTPRALRKMFAEEGFKTLSLQKQFFLPMGIHRGLGNIAFSRTAERVCHGVGLTPAFGSPAILLATRS